MGEKTAGWQLSEVDRILNDPTVLLEPHRVWSLLADVAKHDCDMPVMDGRCLGQKAIAGL